jgi:predicted dithiol-disulfide oxidoreductase (DUF899 family)
MPSTSTVRFPNETAAYRDAREELLAAETELRRKIEEVAALRRRLPAGGAVPEDYEFDEIVVDPSGAERLRPIRLSGLFAPGQPTLLVYSYMYGPEMATPCNMCTSILDGLDGEVPHIRDRVSFAVVAKSPIERVRQVARERGWRNLRLLSSSRNSYNHDYHGETADGAQMPMLNVFVKSDGGVHHSYGTELLYTPSEPGQDFRHVDLIWPLWNLFDLTPEGRGTSWYPKLSYAVAPLHDLAKSARA